MSKRRNTPFKDAHTLEYGLEIASRSPTTKEVESVRCKFCIYFGRECSNGNGNGNGNDERKRKVTGNMKYITKPFRVDNYKSHLTTHKVKWEEYQECALEEKKKFFDTASEKFVITLKAHFDVEQRIYFFL